MAYRDPIPQHGDGPEIAAVLELGSRAMRLRRLILLPAILLGLPLAVVGYLVVREFQFTLAGFAFPWLSGVIGGLPLFAGSVRLGKVGGDRAVRLRAAHWIASLEAEHRLEPGTLAEYRTVL